MKEKQNEINRNDDHIDIGWFFKKAISENKLFVNNLKLHEAKNESLGDYTPDFKTLVVVITDNHKQSTAMRF